MILALLAMPAAAAAQPDFSQTSITYEPAHVSEGDVVTFSVQLRNTGAEAASHASVLVDLPLESLFVDVTGLDSALGRAVFDPIEKCISAAVPLPVGATLPFQFRVVVPRDAGGNLLVPDVRVDYHFRGVNFRAGDPVEIDTAPGTGGVRVGGVRIAPAGLAVLAVLVLYPLLLAVLPRGRRRRGSIAMLVIAAGFLAMFAGLAWRDWQTLATWRAASCTILDTRLRLETTPSNLATGTPPRRRENRTFKALVAVKYSAEGQEIISTGYDTGTRLSIGSGEDLQREYAHWKIGASVPCWFNPDDVRDVIVIRGFGDAYLFALLPLGLVALGVYSLRR